MSASLLPGVVGGRAPVDSAAASSATWKLGEEPLPGASFVAWLTLESGGSAAGEAVSLVGRVFAPIGTDRVATILVRGVPSKIGSDGAIVFDGPEEFDVPHIAVFERDPDPENRRWRLVWLGVEGHPLTKHAPAYAVDAALAHHLLAASRAAAKEPRRAHELLEVVFSSGREIPTAAFFVRAQVWAAEKQWSRVIEDLDTALLREELPPAKLLALRGSARRATGDLAGAVSDLEASLRLHEQGPSWIELAGVHEDAKRPAKAIEAYDRALALLPSHSAGLLARGRLRRLRGDVDAALADLERLHVLPAADLERGLCFQAKGDFRAAERELKKARDAKCPGAADALLALDRDRSLRARGRA